jgi:hypothetical protein
MWNTFGPPASFRHKNAVLDGWCARVGRDPKAIERTLAIEGNDVGHADRHLEAGAEHLIVMRGAPFDLGPVRELLQARG